MIVYFKAGSAITVFDWTTSVKSRTSITIVGIDILGHGCIVLHFHPPFLVQLIFRVKLQVIL
jgi:hypothetical protein